MRHYEAVQGFNRLQSPSHNYCLCRTKLDVISCSLDHVKWTQRNENESQGLVQENTCFVEHGTYGIFNTYHIELKACGRLPVIIFLS